MVRRLTIVMFGVVYLACGSERSIEPGSVKFSWRLGGRTCQDLSVQIVRASLKDANQNDVLDTPPDFPCSDGTGVIENVPPGTYTLVVEGVTAEGKAYYEGRRDGIVVEEGKQTLVSPAISLSLKKSEVLLNWDFPQGTGHCGGNHVVQVEVLVWDSKASSVYEQQHSCVLTQDQYPDNGILLRDLQGMEVYTFILYGFNSANQRTHHGRKDVTTIPGERLDVVVTLTPCPAPDQCP